MIRLERLTVQGFKQLREVELALPPRGRILVQGLNEAGPYQSPMEDGMLHFHEFLRRQIEPHL